jgi:hypothetical protein
MNGFAMIFGHCVWVPPSSKAAMVALSLFFGIGIHDEPGVAAGEALLASQYVSAGKTQTEARKEVAALNACFASYELPADKRTRPKAADLTHLRPAQDASGE